MAKKKISPQSSIEYKKASKKATTYKDYLCCFGHRMTPISDTALEHYANEVVEWAWNETPVHLKEFYLKKGFVRQVWGELVNRNGTLKEAWKFAKEVIGLRRLEQAETGKRDKALVMFTMPSYDEEWKELEEWRATLRSQIEQGDASSEIEKKAMIAWYTEKYGKENT